MSESPAPSLSAARGVTLSPEPFLRYLDPTAETLLLSFALGTGVGEPQLAALGRQLAEEFARILQAHEGFVTLPQMLLATAQEPPLLGSEGGRPRIRPAFAVFHSLPQTQIVQAVSRRLGAKIALTGRLLGDGGEFLLGVNLLDVDRLVLLGCAQREGTRETLPEMVAEIGAYLLARFIDQDKETLLKAATQSVGTRSYKAFYNWAQVRDLERRQGKTDERRVIERLIFALRDDPLYTQPLTKVIELFNDLRTRGSVAEPLLRQLARGLGGVALTRPAVGMIRSEAWRAVNERNEARSALEETLTQHGGVAQLHFMLGQLEETERPQIATRHYQEAYRINPTRDLYRDKALAIGR